MTDANRPSSPLGDALEQTIARLKASTVSHLRRGAVLGVIAVAAPGLTSGCNTEVDPGDQANIEEATNNGRDWAQNQGRRNTAMVQFRRESWHQYTNCASRGGCQSMDVFVKVYVRRVTGANLDQKRVGIVARVADGGGRTAQFLGRYHATSADGWEEWHVQATFRNAEARYFMFNAWYQDGRGNTYYDDNGGELHVVHPSGPNAIVRQAWDGTTLRATGAGVSGHLAIDIADLDYDKDLKVVYSTDNWATTRELRIGNRGDANELYWERDLFGDGERWGVDVNLPGATQMEYAIVYRHGVVQGSAPYEFWDNAGGHNYRITRCDGPRC